MTVQLAAPGMAGEADRLALQATVPGRTRRTPEGSARRSEVAASALAA